MTRRLILGLGLIGLLVIQPGCDYRAKKKAVLPAAIASGPLPSSAGRGSAARTILTSPESEAPVTEIDPEVQRRREIILANFIKLIQTASTNPGGQNFAIATENLNDLFSQGTNPNEFNYNPNSRDFLLRKVYDLTGQDPEPIVKGLCSSKFTTRDARHIEDCMLYRVVANRIAGRGGRPDSRPPDLRLDRPQHRAGFPRNHWVAMAFRRRRSGRPTSLVRGMATEAGNRWSERGWLFMALCRQIGIDVGILSYSPRASMMATAKAAPRPPTSWVCCAIVDQKAYLFEQRIGMEIPGPDGTGVATLEEAINDPNVLARLEIPGLSAYGTTGAELAASPTKINVLIDSSMGFLSPRMRLLQGQLRGEHRTILFRDAREQGSNFKAAMGDRLGLVQLWDLPVRIEERLFSDGNFVAATQIPLQFFDGKLPLLYARSAQLRGDLVEATDRYVALRFAENAVMNNKEKTPIPKDVQRALDFYATYFLAQCQMDRGNVKQAEDLYRKLVEMCPEPGPGRYFYYMLRWGAMSNLAKIADARGDRGTALPYYLHSIQTSDQHGHLYRARQIALENPFDEPVKPLPPAPADPMATQPPVGPATQAATEPKPPVP